MRKRAIWMTLIAGSVVAAGCSDNGGLSDTDLFVGSWTASRVVVNNADLTGFILAQLAIQANFGSGGAFTLDVDYVDPEEEDVRLNGTYTVNESQRMITLTMDTDEGVVQYPMQYQFETEDRVLLTFEEDGTLFGDISGSVRLTVERV